MLKKEKNVMIYGILESNAEEADKRKEDDLNVNRVLEAIDCSSSTSNQSRNVRRISRLKRRNSNDENRQPINDTKVKYSWHKGDYQAFEKALYYIFTNRICNICFKLKPSIVYSNSLNVFKNKIDQEIKNGNIRLI